MEWRAFAFEVCSSMRGFFGFDAGVYGIGSRRFVLSHHGMVQECGGVSAILSHGRFGIQVQEIYTCSTYGLPHGQYIARKQ